MRTCRTCGFDRVPSDSAFCVHCGTGLPDDGSRGPGGRRAVVLALAVLALLGVSGIVAWAAVVLRPVPVPRPDPVPTTSITADPTSSSGTPSSSESPTSANDPTVVALDPAAAQHPDAAVVRAGLTSYYAAIDAHDYDAWLAAVEPSAAEAQSRTAWESGYRTSQDDDVVIETITTGTGGNDLATVSMRSTQDPSDAPPSLPVGRICWTLTLPVDPSTGKVGAARKGSTTMSAC